jgi:4-hydroxybenzoate polyprenyltransferase
MASLKPHLQLIRLPNVFTAAADSLAGWLLVGESLSLAFRWLPLCGASMCIYAAGIALNDVFDFEIDRLERPNRPLPSGRVSRRFAATLGWGLLVLGIVLAGASGSLASLAVGVALAACVVGYDAGLKRTVLGPEVMGSCRGLNVLLGMSQVPDMGGPWSWLVAAAMTIFVVGVTWISRSEVETGKRAGPIAGLMFQDIAFLALFAFAVNAGRVSPAYSALGIVILLGIGTIVNRATIRAIRDPIPKRMQLAVKTGVLSLVWLNVGVVAAVRGPVYAMAVAALWVPAFVLGKWLYST